MDKGTQDIIDAGNDILKSVSKAIDTNDYSRLASDISKTVKSVSFEKRTTYASGVGNNYRQVNNNPNYRNTNNKPFPFLQKKVSRYDGLTQFLLGIGLGVCLALPTLAMLLSQSFVGSIIFLIATAACAFAGVKGFKKLKLSKKFYKYGSILQRAEYFDISDLAKAAVLSDEEVLKDIKDMIKAGYLPRAKLDASEKTCMITDAAYEMYLGAEKDRIAREQRIAHENEVLGKNEKQSDELSPKASQILNEGSEYIKFVRGINDIIPDTEEMSNKLYKLENIMNRIFEQVKKEPASAEDLHKLMNYYLPTTKKLLTAYVELDKQTGGGVNVQQTKSEIDQAMDTINLAFENLLDSLFQDMAWDISSDISVMKTMMAQDGLTGQGATASQGQSAVQMEFK